MKELQQWLKDLGKDYSLEELKSLKNLYLYSNNLTSLPESFGELKSLEQLDLSNDNLTSLPESFGELKSLKRLHLYNNNLTSLPENFSELKNLELLYLCNNPNLVLLESQVKFIESINCHSDLSGFKVIPDTKFAKNLFM